MAARSKWLAEMFHSFPHLNFDFEWTTTIFSPNDKGYQQALMFNGIILLFISTVLFFGLVLYFLVCSCYFCSRCHPPLKPKPNKSRCLRLLIAVFAFFSCVALGVGFYGNNKASDGITNFSSAATDIYDTWDMFKIKNTVARQYYQEGVNNTVFDLVKTLKKYDIPVPEIVYNLTNIVYAVINDLNVSFKQLKSSGVDLKAVAEDAVYYNNLRWWITIAIHGWHLLVVLIVFYSTWRERKCPFILLTIIAVLCLFFMSASISIEVPFSIGAADICTGPTKAVAASVHSKEDKAVIYYYMNCVSGTENPLFKPYQHANETLKQVNDIFLRLEADPSIKKLNDSRIYFMKRLKDFFTTGNVEIEMLINVLGCAYIHKRFNEGVHEVCFTVLEGLALLILAAMMISVFLTSIIVCITPIWKSMARLKSILRKPAAGVRLVTGSYSGPPGHGDFATSSWDTSLDASYKSINEEQQGRTDETVPLVSQNEEPQSYAAVHGSTEFLSVEEDRRRHMLAESEA